MPNHKYSVPWCTLHDIGFLNLPEDCKYRNIDLNHLCDRCEHGCLQGNPCHKDVSEEYHSGGKLLEICSAFEMATVQNPLIYEEK